MSKPARFDQLIRDGLIIKADEITPAEDMGERVRNILMSGQGRKILSAWSFSWKKTVAAAACVTVFGAGLPLALSPGLQAAAAEKANQIMNKIQVVMQTKKVDGGVLSSSELLFADTSAEREARQVIKRNQEKAGGMSGYYYPTLTAAEKETGFHIKTPSYMPEGYERIPSRILVGEYRKDVDGKLVDTGKHDVFLRFDSGMDSYQGTMLSISEIGMEFKPGFKYEAVKVGGKDGRWYESELSVKDEGKEPKGVVERALGWQEDGVTYLLTDYSGLSKEDLVKIVESMK